VKDAHKGEGLGNQFLANIRETAAIVEVVREFASKDVIHVAGKVSPEDDKITIDLELAFADLATVQKRLDTESKVAKSGNKDAKALVAVLEKIKTELDKGGAARNVPFSNEERLLARDLQLLTMKPILYVLNSDEAEVAKEPPDGKTLVLSAVMEANLAGLSDAEVRDYLKEYGLAETGLERLIKKGYELLDLISYFTAGPKETKAWTVQRGTKAPQAAGVIHTDFEKGFIRAEVINWQELLAAGCGRREKSMR
jgi:GTP-binding protein YchF